MMKWDNVKKGFVIDNCVCMADERKWLYIKKSHKTIRSENHQFIRINFPKFRGNFKENIFQIIASNIVRSISTFSIIKIKYRQVNNGSCRH